MSSVTENSASTALNTLSGAINLDDSDMTGVSLNAASRVELMHRLMREDDDPVKNVKKTSPSTSGTTSSVTRAVLSISTRCIVLTNMFNPAE